MSSFEKIINLANVKDFFSSESENSFFFENFAGAVAFCIYDKKDYKFIWASKRYYNELDLEKENVNIDKFDTISTCQDNSIDVYKQALETLINTGEDQTFETWRNICSECCGNESVCIKTTIKLVDKDADKFLVYETIQNITKEKKLFLNVAESENKFRFAAEQANMYAWEYTVATKEMKPCYRCMRDLGLPAIVKNYPEPAIEGGIFPQDYADMYRDWHKQIAAGVPFIEGIIPLTVGRVPFHVRYTTEFDKDGKPYKAFGSATLVVDTNKQAEYQEIINTLIQNFIDVYSIDLEKDKCKIIKVDCELNEELKPFKDGDADFSYSQSFLNFILSGAHPDDVDMLKEAMSKEVVLKELSTKNTYSKTYRCIRTGETHYTQVSYYHIYGKPTMVIGFQYVDDAVSDQRKHAEMLEDALVAAKRANESKTVFLSHMSHDIRTPLNGIIGLLDLEERHPDDASLVNKDRAKMKIAANHLLSLINDVLDLSKMEDSHTTLAKDPFDIRTIYSDILSISEMRASEDKISIIRKDLDNAFSSPYVYGSPLHVRKVLLNIINNAIKYNKKNGSVTCVTDTFIENGKAIYKFTFTDTGIGMSEEFQKHLFEPFSQERADAKSVTQGTGLGMSIVKALIEKMGGTINVSSIMGQGSTFILTIPFEIAKENEIAVEPSVNDIESLEGIKILLAEDNALNAEIATMLLEDAGANVTLVTDGKQAVDAFKNASKGDFNVILMDVMMPVMDGLEATKAIRHLNKEGAKEIPIIAMTANAFAEDIATCKEAGMNAHIAKPLNVNAAIKTIASFGK